MASIEIKHMLSNGREYLVSDTGKPYIGGEYPTGGFRIIRVVGGERLYVDNSPTISTVSDFLKLAAKNKPSTP